MNRFEKALLRYVSEDQLREIQRVRVGIAGAGGLGSNCAVNLVRCGFKNFILVDFDRVDDSNLNRQFYFYHQVGHSKVEMLRDNLLAINPDLNLKIRDTTVNEGNAGTLFSECDVVVEAFDRPDQKQMLVEAYLDSEKLVVAASGLAGWGNSDGIRVHRIRDNFYVVGDLVSDVETGLPPLAPRVGIAAAKQADLILDWVLTKGKDGTVE